MSAPICLLGTDPTSVGALGRVLARCGLTAGPSASTDARPWASVSEEIVTRFTSGESGRTELPDEWEFSPLLEDLVHEVRCGLEGFSPNGPWGWADFHAGQTAPFWKSLLDPPRFVVTIDNPLVVAQALRARERLSIEEASRQWLDAAVAALSQSQGSSRHIVLMEELENNEPRATLALAEFCGLDAPAAGSVLEGTVPPRAAATGLGAVLASRDVDPLARTLYLGLVLSSDSLPDGSARVEEQKARDWLAVVQELITGTVGDTLPEMSAAESEQWRRRATNVEAILTSKDGEIDRLREQLGGLQASLSRTSSHAAALERELERVGEHVSHVELEHQRKADVVEELQAALSRRDEAFENVESALKVSEDVIHEKHEVIEDLRDALRRREEAHEHSMAQIDRLEKELGLIEQKLAALGANNGA